MRSIVLTALCFISTTTGSIDSESRVLAAPSSSGIDPYPYLSGGTFSGPPIPFTPDPLAQYQWSSGVNESQLQVYYLLPANVTLMDGSAPLNFIGFETLAGPWPYVTVSGPGAIQLDYGVESAAWLEFDSPDLLPADLPSVMLGISEYNEYGVFNTGPKVGVPKAYIAGNVTTYRVELNPDLYEGVRFGWINVGAVPSRPWHITGAQSSNFSFTAPVSHQTSPVLFCRFTFGVPDQAHKLGLAVCGPWR
jgi:alpha-L-rhamnosidase